MNAIPGYPLAAFLAPPTGDGVVLPNPATLSKLLDADVVLGREIATQQEYVILGRETLQQVARAEDEAEGYNVLCIEIDSRQGTSDLERLIALVQFVRGRHEFVDFRPAPDRERIRPIVETGGRAPATDSLDRARPHFPPSFDGKSPRSR